MAGKKGKNGKGHEKKVEKERRQQASNGRHHKRPQPPVEQNHGREKPLYFADL
jgi:hypothetical protein